jgi:hypothetical protein
MHKKCTKCGELKDEETGFFRNKKANLKGIRSECKECQRKRQVEYRTTAFAQQQKKNQRRKLKLSILAELGVTNCTRCAEDHWACLEFHHVGDKKFNISEFYHRMDRSSVLEEARKCIVLCANCHRKEHHPE